MSEDPKTPEGPNWLIAEANNRSAEIYQKAMMGVFHRMRVVEELFLTEHRREMELPDKDSLLQTAKDVISLENSIRQQNIKEFPTTNVNAEMPEWYEPFDLSDEVVSDGVDWYLQLRQFVSEDEFLLKKYLQELNRNLFKESDAPPPAQDLEIGGRFSDVIVSLVGSNTFEIRDFDEPTANDNGKENLLSDVASEGANSNAKFIAGIKSLSPEFDRIYEASK